jgi:hypothetical protein
MWPTSLEAFIEAMHGVSVIWRPAFKDQEPPF